MGFYVYRKKEVEHLERLGAGTVGAVYKKDSNYALKVYFLVIKDEQWNEYKNKKRIKNPLLKSHFHMLSLSLTLLMFFYHYL